MNMTGWEDLRLFSSLFCIEIIITFIHSKLIKFNVYDQARPSLIAQTASKGSITTCAQHQQRGPQHPRQLAHPKDSKIAP